MSSSVRQPASVRQMARAMIHLSKFTSKNPQLCFAQLEHDKFDHIPVNLDSDVVLTVEDIVIYLSAAKMNMPFCSTNLLNLLSQNNVNRGETFDTHAWISSRIQ